jgi:hypothetical protein
MKFKNKLSLAILVIGICVLVVGSFTLYRISYNSILKTQSQYTHH